MRKAWAAAIAAVIGFSFWFGCQKRAPDGDELAPAEHRTCNGRFVSKRHSPEDWYRTNGFGDPVACANPKEISVEERVSIPIYWAIAGTNWTEAEVRENLDAASTWFNRYCISLTYVPVPLKTGESQTAAQRLAQADQQGDEKYAKKVRDIYETLWENRMGKPREFLLILFVDPFNAVKYERVVVNVSGNFARIPVILITGADKSSKHIVTHELVHGLGKGIGTGTPPGATPFAGSSVDHTWSEGGCAEEMGNAARTSPSTPMNKSDTAPMDWASYFDYVRAARSVR